jgi:hypothetical protein
VLDPEFGALTHCLVGDLRPCADHDRVNTTGDRAKIVVCAIALHRVRVRVDGKDLVAALPQALVDDVAAVLLRFS